jgi:hypothetical protein
MNGAKQILLMITGLMIAGNYLLRRRNRLSKLAFGRRMNRRHGQHFLRREMICLNRAALIIFVSLAFSLAVEAGTNFYLDPDWTGRKSGTQAYPFAMLNKPAWQKINTALANGDVTIYFSALKADRVTQQSKPSFIQCRRTDYGPNRLTLDGYSFYNSSETSPNWLPNPDTDIAHAYLNGKVFKITGDGAMALGWTRGDGNDFVTHNGLVYCCIESHLASAENEPGVGPNWTVYWDQHGSSGSNWATRIKYKCYVKQNNITLRGFEMTGAGARSGVNGDNLVWEYNYIHDVTRIGPGLQLLYTSHPDSSAAQIISRPSTNLVFRNFRIARTYGEGLYLGSINPDAPAAFQLAHGNQHNHILIENFVIIGPGKNGGQGDGIDCKNGITYLAIRLGEIIGFGANGNGINLPYSVTNTDEHILVDRDFIHDSTFDAQGAQVAIHAQTGGALSTSLYGYNGVTIRNNIVANCRTGIQFSGSTGQAATCGYIFNNTIYNVTPNSGLAVNTNVSNTVVKNNFVFGGANPRGVIGSSGVVSDYNAHDGSWTSSNEGPHTLAMTGTDALASVVNAASGNFHPSANSPLKRAGLTISDFSDDFYQRSRAPGNWTIGAVQVGGDVSAAPSSLQVGP